MPRSANQKNKLLYLAKIFTEETDENHGLTIAEITERLQALDISADRKTLYADFEELRKFGYDITGWKSEGRYTYSLVSREFELPELKLLVDCVQAAKFITEKKSGELIKKLEGLVSRHEAKQLQRQVLISGRIKSMNESVYYAVDTIHTAISRNVCLEFCYFQWDVNKEPVLRHGGEVYAVSPLHLVWDDEYYYLVAYEKKSDMVRHYRVDKMLNVKLTAKPREGLDKLKSSDFTSYSRSLFGMFAGEPETVTLEAENSLAGVIIDRFGKEVTIKKKDEGHFTVRIEAAVSRQFIGWLVGLGAGIKVTAPESVVKLMKDEIKRLSSVYGD